MLTELTRSAIMGWAELAVDREAVARGVVGGCWQVMEELLRLKGRKELKPGQKVHCENGIRRPH